MTRYHACAIALSFALAASASFAQQAQAPADAASAKQNCAKRHDHGADRQAPSSKRDCKPARAKAEKKTEEKKQ